MSSRDRFRTILDDLAAKAKATLPENAGRIDAAVSLVLAGDVVLQPDGLAIVGSATSPLTTYTVNGTCACPDFARAPQSWCKHRVARALALRAERAMDALGDAEAPPTTPADEDPAWTSLATTRDEIPAPEPHANDKEAGSVKNGSLETSQESDATLPVVEGKNGVSAFPLPEAPASATVRLTIAGHADVLFTLRDHDEAQLLRRLETLLQRFPLEPKTQACTPPAPSQTPVCTWHGAMKESTKAPGTYYCPHKLGDGSYCRERWPAKDGRRR